MVKIKIDKEKCIGCGSCEAVCPKTFEMLDGKAVVKQQPKELTCEKEVQDICPVQAIMIS